MRKRAFRPMAIDPLEDRLALSGVNIPMLNGTPLLTQHAAFEAAGRINNAYLNFANDGLNYGCLIAGLNSAVSLIPYAYRDGLHATLMSEVTTMQSDIANGVSQPVITALQNSEADLKSFIQSEVAAGAFLYQGTATPVMPVPMTPVLTHHAAFEAAGRISSAYVNFANHGLNYGRLIAGLNSAVSLIPYAYRDGLHATLMSEVTVMQSDIANGVPHPVIAALQSSEADLKSFIQSEVAAGTIRYV